MKFMNPRSGEELGWLLGAHMAVWPCYLLPVVSEQSSLRRGGVGFVVCTWWRARRCVVVMEGKRK